MLAFFLSCEKLYLLKWKSRWLGKANTIGLSIARAPGGIKTEEALKSTNSGGISVPLKGFDHPPEKEFIFLPDVTWGHHTAGTNSSRRFLKHLDSNSMVQVLRKPTRKSFLLDSFCIKRYRNMGWFMWNQSRAGKKKRKNPTETATTTQNQPKKKNPTKFEVEVELSEMQQETTERNLCIFCQVIRSESFFCVCRCWWVPGCPWSLPRRKLH